MKPTGVPGNTEGDWGELLPPKDEEQNKPTGKDNTSQDEERPNNNDDTQKPVEDNNKEEENKPVDETKPEEETKPQEKPQQTPSKEEEDKKDETPIKEELPKEDVKISSLSGTTAYAGDTVQFKITGDVKSVEGLEGLDYSLSNGCLTINTSKDEATVITPKVIGENGSTATATVTVSVLNFE